MLGYSLRWHSLIKYQSDFNCLLRLSPHCLAENLFPDLTIGMQQRENLLSIFLGVQMMAIWFHTSVYLANSIWFK